MGAFTLALVSYHASHEQFPPSRLLRLAVEAEEAGFEVELVELIGVYTSRPGNAVSTIFLARSANGEAPVRMDSESSAHAWVGRAEVPAWLPRMAFRSMATALADWAEGRRGVPRDW